MTGDEKELLSCPFCGASKWEISFHEPIGKPKATLNHESNCFFHTSTYFWIPSDAYEEWTPRRLLREKEGK
jgi:hypothetical protein